MSSATGERGRDTEFAPRLRSASAELFRHRSAAMCSLGAVLIEVVLLQLAAMLGDSDALPWLAAIALVAVVTAVLGGSGAMMLASAASTAFAMIAATGDHAARGPVLFFTGCMLLVAFYLHDFSRSMRRVPQIDPATVRGFVLTVTGLIGAAGLIAGIAIVGAGSRTWDARVVPLALVAVGLLIVGLAVVVRRAGTVVPARPHRGPAVFPQPPPPAGANVRAQPPPPPPITRRKNAPLQSPPSGVAPPPPPWTGT